MPDGSYFLNEDIVNMLNVPTILCRRTGKYTEKRNRAQTI